MKSKSVTRSVRGSEALHRILLSFKISAKNLLFHNRNFAKSFYFLFKLHVILNRRFLNKKILSMIKKRNQ